MMVTFIVIAVLLAITLATSATTTTPCYGEGCNTWWARVRHLNYPKFRGPSEEEARQVSDMISVSKNQLAPEGELRQNTVYSHHYILPIGEIQSLPERSQWTTMKNTEGEGYWFNSRTTGRTGGYGTVPLSEGHRWATILSTKEVNRLIEEEILDFTGKGFTGEDVKAFFDSISGINRNVTKQLRRLHLTSNHIQYLPVGVFPVVLEYRLEELKLDDNPFNYLSSYTSFELSRLGHLRRLSLARTGLSYLNSLYIPSLQELDLSNNHFTYVPQCLESLQNLRQLNMSGNHLAHSEFSTISKLVNLQVLSFSSNGLMYIKDDTFASLHSLQVLHLNNNSLTSFTDMKIRNVHLLYISSNPWECSCHLLSTAIRPMSIIKDVESLTCFDGDKLLLRKMSSFTEEDAYLRCRRKWDWFKDREEQLERVGFWFRHQLHHLSTVLTFVWWVFVCVSLVLVVQFLWRSRRKLAQSVAPYNILDDKLII